MPTVFVYEYCCAVGLGRDPSDPAHSLYREGRAMRDAVAEDFGAVRDTTVTTIDAVEPLEEADEIVRRARGADWSLVIAPEFSDLLLTLTRAVADSPGRLLGPSPTGVELCSDKLRLAGVWRGAGLATPSTAAVGDHRYAQFPVVVKPRDGAGSEFIQTCHTLREVVRHVDDLRTRGCLRPLIAQDFVPGRPASVAFLVGPSQTVPLLPTFQLLSSDGRFRYEGGALPIRPELAARAVTLGRRAIDCVPGLFGYVGVDLILGDADDGSRDYAIEINPRLTTSYVGLRRLAAVNLAEVMLNAATGQAVGHLRWRPGRVRFRPDGTAAYEPDAPWFGPG